MWQTWGDSLNGEEGLLFSIFKSGDWEEREIVVINIRWNDWEEGESQFITLDRRLWQPCSEAGWLHKSLEVSDWIRHGGVDEDNVEEDRIDSERVVLKIRRILWELQGECGDVSTFQRRRVFVELEVQIFSESECVGSEINEFIKWKSE